MMNKTLWQPSAEIETLRQRSLIIQKIRAFFYQREVMEVETPSLSLSSVTDVHLEAFSCQYTAEEKAKTLFLQTSPEFAMKRLLAAGSGSIFQLCKAFRHEEPGRYHNPEFTMLEWYRVGFTMQQLIAEVAELLTLVLPCSEIDQLSYQQAFLQYIDLDPLNTDSAQLITKAKVMDIYQPWLDNECNDTLLQYIFSMVIEKEIGQSRPCVISHFPASQAALAKLDETDNRVAHRFEVYFKGNELANGFAELTDPFEQEDRFDRDNQLRRASGKSEKEKDRLFLQALSQGLPACAGIALGIDRLIMLALGKNSIDQVISFTVDRC